jgi:hypothetical protein
MRSGRPEPLVSAGDGQYLAAVLSAMPDGAKPTGPVTDMSAA